jgi:hypothetical protein
MRYSDIGTVPETGIYLDVYGRTVTAGNTSCRAK